MSERSGKTAETLTIMTTMMITSFIYVHVARVLFLLFSVVCSKNHLHLVGVVLAVALAHSCESSISKVHKQKSNHFKVYARNEKHY